MSALGAEWIEAELAAARAEAEAGMTDTCSITYENTSGQQVYDESTANYVWPTVTVYGPDIAPYFGKCYLKAPNMVNPFTATAADTNWQVEQSVLGLPALAPSIESGWTVNYLTAPYNPSLEGRVFGVIGPHHESQSTAQRVIVKEVVGSGGTGT